MSDREQAARDFAARAVEIDRSHQCSDSSHRSPRMHGCVRVFRFCVGAQYDERRTNAHATRWRTRMEREALALLAGIAALRGAT